MSGLGQRFHTFNKSVSPKALDTQSQKQLGFICRQEKKITNRAHSATAPSHPLEKASDSWWCADLYYAVEVANVDPQLQRRRCNDRSQARRRRQPRPGGAPRPTENRERQTSVPQPRANLMPIPQPEHGKYEAPFTPMDASLDAHCVVNRADVIGQNFASRWPCTLADYSATYVPGEPCH